MLERLKLSCFQSEITKILQKKTFFAIYVFNEPNKRPRDSLGVVFNFVAQGAPGCTEVPQGAPKCPQVLALDAHFQSNVTKIATKTY